MAADKNYRIMKLYKFGVFCLILLFSFIGKAQENSAKVASQNPSPMVDNTRAHERIEKKNYPGDRLVIENLFKRKVDVFVPEKDKDANNFDLLIHFHGGDYVVDYAAEKYKGKIIAATLNLGAGSSVYYNPFSDSTVFTKLVSSIINETSNKLGHQVKINRIILSGFSAGYGAVKRILSYPNDFRKVDAVLLLDGLHASYIPERKVVFRGGRIDTGAFHFFVKFAKDACEKNSTKKFLFTHSEIFPGTFVSTTEAADYLISKLGVKNKAVLKWGPLGMQQLSEARKNHFAILGFAGNTAPDHIDHLHSLFHFLNLLMQM